jgi:uncharacterized protein
VKFEWDPEKADTNFLKHGVTFEEATTVFKDRFAMTETDTAHSSDEERLLSLGMSELGRLLVVVHTDTELEGDIVVRIISSRKAEARERAVFQEDR